MKEKQPMRVVRGLQQGSAEETSRRGEGGEIGNRVRWRREREKIRGKKRGKGKDDK